MAVDAGDIFRPPKTEVLKKVAAGKATLVGNGKPNAGFEPGRGSFPGEDVVPAKPAEKRSKNELAFDAIIQRYGTVRQLQQVQGGMVDTLSNMYKLALESPNGRILRQYVEDTNYRPTEVPTELSRDSITKGNVDRFWEVNNFLSTHAAVRIIDAYHQKHGVIGKASGDFIEDVLNDMNSLKGSKNFTLEWLGKKLNRSVVTEAHKRYVPKDKQQEFSNLYNSVKVELAARRSKPTTETSAPNKADQPPEKAFDVVQEIIQKAEGSGYDVTAYLTTNITLDAQKQQLRQLYDRAMDEVQKAKATGNDTAMEYWYNTHSDVFDAIDRFTQPAQKLDSAQSNPGRSFLGRPIQRGKR